ncbi:uncharacterized protein N7482_000174 [Penicillium canariense]|uniref:RanBD1 domain-containing protein n=1 Tax=Penicillium canariense TaxID=189055 RepID=A0A9W9IDF3_9EURO|nr:uncharacterized protein N7482_000174 [Penicillium canariense]KAJ5174297.1 hypothetical protein N7482_000174 [Penicillium canariense]
MSKRTAQGPQGSKESEQEFAMSSTPDDKPHRATAAQMANRKIKDIRKRPRGTTPTGGTGASESSGTFSQLSSTPAFSASTFSAPSNQSGGFNFGQSQSQSFPGASAAPSQPSQAGAAPFSFGGSGSTSFNFGGGFGSAPSNPFANNPFSAANSAPAQPAPATGSTSFGGFGNQSNPRPAFSFGAPQNGSSSVGTGLFGQPAATSATGNPAADSMQTSPDSKPKGPFALSPSFPTKNLFSDSGASNLFSPKPATPASNPFGGLSIPPASEKPSSDKAESLAAKPAFGSQTSTASSQAQPFGTIFGSPATTTPSEPEKAATNNIFAPKAATPGSVSSNPFMPKPPSSEPEKVNTTQPANNNIFSPKPAAVQSTTSNLFAPKPAEQTSTSNLFTSKTSSGDTSSNLTNPQPFKNLFGATTEAQLSPAKPAAEQASSNNLFAPKFTTGHGPEKPAENQPFTSMFGTTTKPAADQSLSKPAEAQPFKNLFGAASPTPKPAEPATTSSLFASKPAAELPSDKPSDGQPFKSHFGATTSTPTTSEPANSSSILAGTPNLFAPKSATEQPAASPAKPFANLFGGNNAAPQINPVKASPTASSSFTSAQKAQGAAAMPSPSLPAGSSKEVTENAELLWKIRALDTHFKQEFMKYEPGTNSFDDLILFYINIRHGMGAPLKGAPELRAKKLSEKPVNADGPNGSVTSNVFAKSFSSPSPSPAKPVAAPNQTKSSAENLFAKSLTDGNANSSAPAASPAAKLAGNMFAQATSSNAQSGSASPAIPKFGNGTGAVDFMAQFKQQAEKTMAEEKAKRKAEDFDSDEDDEAEWDRRDAEEQREKRAKLEAGNQKKPVFKNGKFEWVDVDEPTPSAPAGNTFKPVEKAAASPLFVPTDNSAANALSPASSTGSIFESASRPLPASENIFGSLTPKHNDADKDSDGSDDEGKAESSKRQAEEDGSTDDDFASALRKSKRTKPSETKSSLNTPLPAPTATAGRSLFDRIGSPTPTPQKETSTSTSSLFSASFGQSTSFGQSNSAPADNTWKPDSPIKFSSDSTPAATPAPASTLAPSTLPSSGINSGEATPEEEAPPGAIFDMSQANAGEEEETLIFECRARAFKLATGWTSKGTGIVRLLKHPETGRARIVLRADPGGNVILNTFLKKEFDYARQSNSVQFMVPQPGEQQPEHWAIRVNAKSIEDLYNKIQEIKN